MPAASKTGTKKTAATPGVKAAPGKKAPARGSAGGTTAKPKAAARKTGAAAKPAAKAHKHPVSAEQRRYYVEVAAYYIAERHGFTPGRELADWTAAEVEIDRLLAEGALNP